MSCKPKPFLSFLLPVVLLAAYVLQCAWFIRTQSLTWDEPIHIISGLEMWRQGHFAHTPDHPPLGQLFATFPLARGPWHIEPAAGPEVWMKSITPDPELMASRARSMNVILGVLLGVLLWFTARNLFSEGAANLALALFVFSPSLIAHFSLVTTDALIALMLFATAVQLMRWRRRPTWTQALLLGVCLGLLLLSKFSAPPLFCLALGIVLAAKPDGWAWRPNRWNWSYAALVGATAVLVLWAGYTFHVSTVRIHNGTLEMSFPHREPISMPTDIRRDLTFRVPAGEYLYGVRQVIWRSEAGQSKFVLGKISSRELLLLQPLAVLLKWPTAVLALFAWSVVLLTKQRLKQSDQSRPSAAKAAVYHSAVSARLKPCPSERWPSEGSHPENRPSGRIREDAGSPQPSVTRHCDIFILAAFPVGLILLATASRIASGERHIMGAYPFVLLFASATWDYARQQGRKLVATVILAAALNALDTLRFAPDYLSYFPVFVPGTQSYRLLSDSNLDWGNGLLALRRYEEQHPGEPISLAYFGSVDPAVYGIKARRFGPHDRPTGTVVVSATNLSGTYVAPHKAYRWLTTCPLETVLNHTLFVYRVPPEGCPTFAP